MLENFTYGVYSFFGYENKGKDLNVEKKPSEINFTLSTFFFQVFGYVYTYTKVCRYKVW